MNTQEFLHKYPTTETNKVRPHIFCKDGLELSVQASSGHYCAPREDNALEYTHVEVLCPHHVLHSLREYSKRSDVCVMVPVDLLDRIIKRHGGIVHIGWRNNHGDT